MAAGKTTVGRILADRLGWGFIDFDDAIAERVGQPPGAVIRDRGEAAFRALEAEVTRELADRRQVVLAPGGGWAVQPSLMESMGSGTALVWLRVTPEEAVRRAEADGADRPLLGPPEGRVARMARLLRSRERRYRTADVVVDVDDREPPEVAEAILHRLGSSAGGE